MKKQRVCVLLVDHGGSTDLTLFEHWQDARAEFERVVTEYNREDGVSLEAERQSGPRLVAYDEWQSYPFIECRKQVVEP